MDFQKGLDNVLNGQSAMGHAWPGKPRAVSFPKDASVISALAQACDTLHADIKQSVGLQDDQSMSLFLAKMAVWCAKQGWNTAPDLTHGFNTVRVTLVDAITESPYMISDEKAGIAGILKKHHARAAQGIVRLRKTMMTDPNAPPHPIMDVGDYELVELLTPNHLKAESVSIGGTCCVGTNYNKTLLTQRGLQEGDEGSDDCLTYAIKIRSGKSRIFSLRRAGDNQSVATIEYDPKHQSIKQIEGNPTQISAQSPFFPALCLALSRFSDHNIPLNGAIVGLPDCPPNHILTTNGVLTPYKKDGLHAVLRGHITVHEGMTQDEVHALCRDPRLTIDITECSNDWLNAMLSERIEGTVKSSTEDATLLNHVQYMGGFDAVKAAALSLPALKDVGGSFYARDASTLTLPALQNVGGSFHAGKAESIIIHPAMTHRLPSHLRIGEGAPSRKPTSPHP